MAYKERLQNNNDELKDIIAIAESLPEVEFVPSGTLDITANGEYNVAEYEKASVNVPIPEGYIKPTGSINITENGRYDVTEYEEVEVEVVDEEPVIEPITITENGTYNVPENIDGYGPITVEVAGSGGGGSSGDDTLKGLMEGTLTTFNNSDITLLRSQACTSHNSLEEVTLPNVISTGQSVFYMNKKLKKVSMSNLVQSDHSAFAYCESLTDVNMPKLETIANSMFSSCSALQTISLPSLKRLENYSFSNCTALESVDLPKANDFYGSYLFNGCQSLKTVNAPLANALQTYTFQNCYVLERLDFSNMYTIYANAFKNCYSLKTLILRKTSGVSGVRNTAAFTNCYHFHGTVDATYNPNGDKDGYIYVPSTLIDSYKIATNWSAFADQFRAIEDYPEICGEV